MNRVVNKLCANIAVLLVLLWIGIGFNCGWAQGSATVAMLTTSSMVYPMMQGVPLPYHPIYIFLAIGFGSKALSWMNDSGFWTVSKLSGFTEKETLQSWSVIVTTISISGLLLTLVAAAALPFK